ncbi:hypothetical protein [Pseudovibrio sp. SPO723]|uniref:hypothetical protein n=1 Tax=Nesiotobacter zosterae TaxID=392721 RepID=UPI0029C4E190|nr:hypothetical protein [Pseudovibrio sp. SPO723]MDX5592880.1 hypothetical protein [Pseudovibrio sp. SPO723]
MVDFEFIKERLSVAALPHLHSHFLQYQQACLSLGKDFKTHLAESPESAQPRGCLQEQCNAASTAAAAFMPEYAVLSKIVYGNRILLFVNHFPNGHFLLKKK